MLSPVPASARIATFVASVMTKGSSKALPRSGAASSPAAIRRLMAASRLMLVRLEPEQAGRAQDEDQRHQDVDEHGRKGRSD